MNQGADTVNQGADEVNQEAVVHNENEHDQSNETEKTI